MELEVQGATQQPLELKHEQLGNSGLPGAGRGKDSRDDKKTLPMARTHHSKTRATMSPSFGGQWTNSQQGTTWNSYSSPRSNLHYQPPQTSYTFCTSTICSVYRDC